MHVLLIARGEVDPLAPDPLTAPLSKEGRRRVSHVAGALNGREIDLLCAAGDTASAETADILAATLRPAERWDLADLEALNRDDLALEPTALPRPERWSPEQMQFGLERLWVRVTPVWARIAIYAEAQGYGQVAVVADPLVQNMLLRSWQGRDWRALEKDVGVSTGEVLRVILDGDAMSVQPLVG